MNGRSVWERLAGHYLGWTKDETKTQVGFSRIGIGCGVDMPGPQIKTSLAVYCDRNSETVLVRPAMTLFPWSQ
jgi:hypothetical protein